MEVDFIEIPLIIYLKSGRIDTIVKGFIVCFSCLYALYFGKRGIN